MKIAIIGHKEIPSRKGGVEVVVEKVSTMLVNKGHTVDVYNRKHIGSKNNNVKRYKGVKLINVPTININGLEALIYSFIATLIAILGRYDVMYYHAEGPASMCFIPYILGIKTVVTIHGLDWKRSKWNRFAKMYLKFGEKMAAKYADEIIVLSEDMRQYFLSTYNRETTFIANGIEKHEYKKVDEIEKKWNLKKDDYILYVGRIVPEKGIHYLIDAFKDIKTDKKLVIADDGSLMLQIDEGKRVHLNKLSSGEKQLIILLLSALLQKGKRGIYITDEPELSLHISWQEKLINALHKINPNIQLIIATHSPDIVAKYENKIKRMEGILK